MIKPKRLKKGDKIAIVSLSWGGLGDAKLIHKYDIAKERLERDFGLNVVAMPHALRGSEFVYAHPELRAKDLMDVFPMIVGTEIWPERNEWKDKILLVETSEEKPSPDLITYYLRNLGAQGILNRIRGIVVGKPQDERFYEEYKEVYRAVLKEFDCETLPVIYNVNIGHATPTGILPLGTECEINLEKNYPLA